MGKGLVSLILFLFHVFLNFLGVLVNILFIFYLVNVGVCFYFKKLFTLL